MMSALPTGGFQWVEDPSTIDIVNLDIDGPEGYFLEVDLLYPDHLHDLHNDYPLAPERMKVKKEQLSPYSLELLSHMGLRHMGNVPKLVPNLLPKTKYVLHSRTLQLYMSLGLEVTAVHRALRFNQRPWLKQYIDFNTQKRRLATSTFEKDLWKLMNNAVFGKSMEDPRKHRQIELVNDPAIFRKRVAKATFQSFRIFDENLVAVEYKKQTIKLNKPIYVGAAILDISKTYMYDYHFNHMKKVYGDKILVNNTDTDSLNYTVYTEDLYADMGKNPELYDFSDYPSDHPLYSIANKKVPGKFKDEVPNGYILEQVGLRPKTNSNHTTVGVKKVAKGIAKAAKQKLTHEMYKASLFLDIPVFANMTRLQRKNHQMYAVQITKLALTPTDDKRYVREDGIATYAYGHYRILEEEAAQIDWDMDIE